MLGFSLKLKLTFVFFTATLFIAALSFYSYRHITILPENRPIFIFLLFGCCFFLTALFNVIILLTQRNLIQKELNPQNSKLQDLNTAFNQAQKLSHVGSWQWNMATDEAEWSDEMYNIYGVTKENFYPSNENVAKTVLPEDLNKIKQGVESLLNDKLFAPFEFRIKRPSGEIRNLFIVALEKKSKDILFGVTKDITEQKKAESALKESEERQRLVANATLDAYYDWDMLSDSVWRNDSFLNAFGKPNENEQNSNWWSERIHPDDLEAVTQSIQAAIKERKSLWQFEYRFRNSNLEYRYLFDRGLLHYDNNGKPIRFIGAMTDFTERKQTEQKLTLMADQLKAAQKLAKIGSWETDLTNLAASWSQETYRIFELNDDSFKVSHQTFLEFVHPDDRVRVDNAIKKSLDKDFDNSIEHRIITSKGNIRDVEERWKIIKDFEGKPVRVVGTCQDITEKKHTEQELMKAKKLAEAANEAKSDFLANMSHEIRTPLNSVIGFTDLVLKTNLEPDQKLYLNTVYQSANFLLTIVNDILDFSKIEAGKLTLKMDKVNVFSIAEQSADVIKYKAQEKGIDIVINVDKDIPIIRADSIRLRQIMLNLLSNSIKFTYEGKIEINIELRKIISDKNEIPEEAELLFSVRDTGIGISKENLEFIFESFAQVDTSTNRKYGGTGLGLTISNKLLALMDTKLELETELGKGSNFFFLLKAKIESEDSRLIENTQTEEIINPKELFIFPKKICILIVDDDVINRFLANTLVKKILPDADIVEAENGIDAIEKFKTNKIDLILMDIQMPEMNGHEATKEIRKIKTNTKVPIIAITAGIKVGDKEKCLEEGMDGYVVKPIKKEIIEEILYKWLG